MTDERKVQNAPVENRQDQDVIREFHGEAIAPDVCLGSNCPNKDCRICNAAGKGRGRVFEDEHGNMSASEATWDSYRGQIKGGYYTKSIIEVVDPATGKRKFIYHRPE